MPSARAGFLTALATVTLCAAVALQLPGCQKPPPSRRENSPACVATMPDASLTLTLRTQGCFGGDTSFLELTVVDGRAGLRTDRLKPPLAVDDDERRRIIEELDAALARPEIPSGCSTTTTHGAGVSWSCAGETQALEFETSECGDAEGDVSVGASTAIREGPARGGHAHALAMHAIEHRLLRAHGLTRVARPLRPSH